MTVAAGVAGTRGIGAIHAREYLRAGVERLIVAGRTPESARAQAAILAERFGKPVEAVDSLDQLARSDVVGLSLCTPTADHFDHLLAVLAGGRRVLCEKPLFWASGMAQQELDDRLARLEAAAAPGQLHLHTPNSYFLEAALDRFDLPRRPAVFRFEFFTQGSSRGRAIGVDLLPHALSLLRVLDPTGEVSAVELGCDDNSFGGNLQYGGVAVELEFRQAAGGEKRLAFELDGTRIERVPYMRDGAYRVALRAGQQTVDVEDPFAVAIRGFLAGWTSPQTPDLAGASQMTRQMATILAAV